MDLGLLLYEGIWMFASWGWWGMSTSVHIFVPFTFVCMVGAIVTKSTNAEPEWRDLRGGEAHQDTKGKILALVEKLNVGLMKLSSLDERGPIAFDEYAEGRHSHGGGTIPLSPAATPRGSLTELKTYHSFDETMARFGNLLSGTADVTSSSLTDQCGEVEDASSDDGGKGVGNIGYVTESDAASSCNVDEEIGEISNSMRTQRKPESRGTETVTPVTPVSDLSTPCETQNVSSGTVSRKVTSETPSVESTTGDPGYRLSELPTNLYAAKLFSGLREIIQTAPSGKTLQAARDLVVAGEKAGHFSEEQVELLNAMMERKGSVHRRAKSHSAPDIFQDLSQGEIRSIAESFSPTLTESPKPMPLREPQSVMATPAACMSPPQIAASAMVPDHAGSVPAKVAPRIDRKASPDRASSLKDYNDVRTRTFGVGETSHEESPVGMARATQESPDYAVSVASAASAFSLPSPGKQTSPQDQRRAQLAEMLQEHRERLNIANRKLHSTSASPPSLVSPISVTTSMMNSSPKAANNVPAPKKKYSSFDEHSSRVMQQLVSGEEVYSPMLDEAKTALKMQEKEAEMMSASRASGHLSDDKSGDHDDELAEQIRSVQERLAKIRERRAARESGR